MVEYIKGVGVDEKEAERGRDEARALMMDMVRELGITDANELYIAMRDMFAGTLEDVLKAELGTPRLRKTRPAAKADDQSAQRRRRENGSRTQR